MDRCIVFTRPDGSTAVLHPLGPRQKQDLGQVVLEEGDDAYLERIALQDVPVVLKDGTETDRRAAEAAGAEFTQLPYSIILLSNVPTDRLYRNAWALNGGIIRHDMPKCRLLHKARLRELRKAAMANLDGQWMRAIAAKQDAAAAAIEAKRQAWRDAPADPRIEAAADVAALRAIPLPADT